MSERTKRNSSDMGSLCSPPPPRPPSPFFPHLIVGVTYVSSAQCGDLNYLSDTFCDDSGWNYPHKRRNVCCGCTPPQAASVRALSLEEDVQDDRPGIAYCFGSRDSGEAGDGRHLSQPSTVEAPRPPAVPLGVSSQQLFTAIAVSHQSFITSHLLSPFVCAIAADSGRPWCWGRFPLSNATLWSPTIVPGERMFTKIASGGTYACGIDLEGAVACWTGVASEPIVISSITSFSGLAMGINSVCGLSGTTVWCWGSLSLLVSISTPVAVVAVGAQGFVSISAGPSMTCGVSTTTDIWCWSIAPDGASIGAKITAYGFFSFVSVGKDAACAIDFYGHASCWGVNPYNWLGLEDASAIVTTASPVRGSFLFQTISVGYASGKAHVCGVLTGGRLVCWGGTAFGRTGTGFPDGTLTAPTEVDTSAMQPTSSSIAYSVASSASFTCALFSETLLTSSLDVSRVSDEKWRCLLLGWQFFWDGVREECVHAPDCDAQGTGTSWDGMSCTLDFTPASCTSEFSYDSDKLSCGRLHGALLLEPPFLPFGNWADNLPPINASISTVTALPSRDTPLGAALMVDEDGTITVFMSVFLFGASASGFDQAARNAFGDAVLASLIEVGVNGNLSNMLVVITDVRDVMKQVDDGTTTLRRAAVTISSYEAQPPALDRRVSLVDTMALAIAFYISSHDTTAADRVAMRSARFALKTAALAAFAADSPGAATQAGITSEVASFLGSSFKMALTGALQTSTCPAFAAVSILALSTMREAAPSISPTLFHYPASAAAPSPDSNATDTIVVPAFIPSDAAVAATASARYLSAGEIVAISFGAAAIVAAAFLTLWRGAGGGGESFVFLNPNLINGAIPALNEASPSTAAPLNLPLPPAVGAARTLEAHLRYHRSSAAANLMGGGRQGNRDQIDLPGGPMTSSNQGRVDLPVSPMTTRSRTAVTFNSVNSSPRAAASSFSAPSLSHHHSPRQVRRMQQYHPL